MGSACICNRLSRPPRQQTLLLSLRTHRSVALEKIKMDEILLPADKKEWSDLSLSTGKIRSERMGWLPSAPQTQN